MLHPQKSSVQLVMERGSTSALPTVPKQGRSPQAAHQRGLSEARRVSRLLSHFHRLSTFLCVVLSDQLSVHCPQGTKLF